MSDNKRHDDPVLPSYQELSKERVGELGFVYLPHEIGTTIPWEEVRRRVEEKKRNLSSE